MTKRKRSTGERAPIKASKKVKGTENENKVSKGWQWWGALGRPTKVAAPLVSQSEAAFRELVRRYGVELCYTPMMLSSKLVEDEAYNKAVFDVREGEKVIAQIAGSKKEDIVNAAALVGDRCVAIDINLGCPQDIAKRGCYGAFMDHETALECVRELSSQQACPVTVKIRRKQTVEETRQYMMSLQEAGAAMVCVHARTLTQRSYEAPDWDHVKAVLQEGQFTIPVLGNGGIQNAEHLRDVMGTGCVGGMSGEGLLYNPASLYEGEAPTGLQLAKEYLDICKKLPPSHISIPRKHLYYMLAEHWDTHIGVYDRLFKATQMEELRTVISQISSGKHVLREKDAPRPGGRPRKRTKVGALAAPPIGGLSMCTEGGYVAPSSKGKKMKPK